MATMLEYAKSETRSFEKLPLNELDSLIFSEMAYYAIPQGLMAQCQNGQRLPLSLLLDAKRIPTEVANAYDPKKSALLMQALRDNPRFNRMTFSDACSIVDPKAETQFACVAFHFQSDFTYVAFRGTDSSSIGWKEDLNMSFAFPVTAQTLAKEKLEAISGRANPILYAGGHSKGGNLAAYAGLAADPALDSRIRTIFDHDGPGFPKGAFNDSPRWNRLQKTVPCFSVFGMIMEYRKDYRVVASDGFSVWQHDPFTWLTEGDGFKRRAALDKAAASIDISLNQLLEQYGRPERQQVIDDVFRVVFACGIARMKDAKKHKALLLKEAKAMPPQSRALLLKVLKTFVANNVEAFGQTHKPVRKPHKPILIRKGLPFPIKPKKSLKSSIAGRKARVLSL